MPEINTVADVPDDWRLITGAYGSGRVIEQIGEDPDDYSHGGVFVNTEDGEYKDVIFFPGEVPYLYKDVTRLL